MGKNRPPALGLVCDNNNQSRDKGNNTTELELNVEEPSSNSSGDSKRKKNKPASLNIVNFKGLSNSSDTETTPTSGGGNLVDDISEDIKLLSNMRQLNDDVFHDAEGSDREDVQQYQRRAGINQEYEFQHGDFKFLHEIGRGSSGVVEKVIYKTSKQVMARKVIRLEVKHTIRKQICKELRFLHECSSPFIVKFYGSYIIDKNVCICMEYMDGGSLDMLYQRSGPLQEDVLSMITLGIVNALYDLRENHNILHRDVKPSNVLLNTKGQVKMCDFGVSGELINSQVDSFVGTKSYMSPERLKGAPYAMKSDIWSLGMSLVEVGIGRFPIPPSNKDDSTKTVINFQPVGMAFLELLQYIVNEDPPQLPHDRFGQDACDFVSMCLYKDVNQRASLQNLVDHSWMDKARKCQSVNSIDLAYWVKQAIEQTAAP